MNAATMTECGRCEIRTLRAPPSAWQYQIRNRNEASACERDFNREIRTRTVPRSDADFEIGRRIHVIEVAGRQVMGVGVALIIPVINEGETIFDVVDAVPRDLVDEVIVVDGGSTDDTVANALRAGARVLTEPRAGYGAACHAGILAAPNTCGIIAFIDGDGSDNPGELRKIVAPILDGEQDFVIGSRARGVREPGSMGLHQLLAGQVAGLAIRALYGTRFTDMCPLRAIRREVLCRLGMRERTYGWNLEMQMRAARAGLRILELPVSHRIRAGGKSKVAGSFRGTLRASFNLAAAMVRIAAEVR
jgi:glycosyltransferase involved in cell wall biosynthesis